MQYHWANAMRTALVNENATDLDKRCIRMGLGEETNVPRDERIAKCQKQLWDIRSRVHFLRLRASRYAKCAGQANTEGDAHAWSVLHELNSHANERMVAVGEVETAVLFALMAVDTETNALAFDRTMPDYTQWLVYQKMAWLGAQ